MARPTIDPMQPEELHLARNRYLNDAEVHAAVEATVRGLDLTQACPRTIAMMACSVLLNIKDGELLHA